MPAPMVKTSTPGIFKRGGRYVVTYYVNGRQRKESARSMADARRLKAERQADLARGEFFEASRLTFREYASEWIDRYQGNGGGFRETTRAGYRGALDNYALPYFDAKLKRKVSEIAPRDVSNFVGWLCDERAQSDHAYALSVTAAKRNGKDAPKRRHVEKRLSDSTVRNIVKPLRACLSTAVSEGLIRSNPVRDVRMPSRPRLDCLDGPVVRTFTREQLSAALTVVHPRHRVMFRVLAGTGLRISELIALRWMDVELDGLTPHVKVRRAYVVGHMHPPKSRHGRRDVPIGHALVVDLRGNRAGSEWCGDDDLVFPSLAGKPLHVENLRRRVLHPAVSEAGASWAGFHTFRHTFASMMFERGANAVQVQRWLGHHSPDFTLKTYVHLLDNCMGEALDLDSELRVAMKWQQGSTNHTETPIAI